MKVSNIEYVKIEKDRQDFHYLATTTFWNTIRSKVDHAKEDIRIFTKIIPSKK